MKKIIIASIVVLVLVIAFFVWSNASDKNINQTNNNNATLNEENVNQTAVTEIQETSSPLTNLDECQPKPNEVYYPVKELGVEILVDKTIADDLIYEFSAKNPDDADDLGSVMFTTKSLVAKDSYCIAEYGPLGALSRIKGEPREDLSTGFYYRTGREKELKQFAGCFFAISHPQSTCSGQRVVNDYSIALREKINFLDKTGRAAACIRPINNQPCK